MSLFVSKVINSAIQIVLFTLIPFIWWLVTARKECGFFEWIGVKRPRAGESKKPLLWAAGTSVVFLIVSLFVLYSVKNVETATSEFSGLGVKAVPAVLIYAVFNTALPEEILFRGFLLKRIANKAGFAVGNMIQAAAFGLMHGVLFFSSVRMIKAIIITLFTGLVGWLMGFINEKKADGSILSGWLIHSIANIFSGLSAAFGLFL
jgi:membrane protease YdiL (CAAX protease family)